MTEPEAAAHTAAALLRGAIDCYVHAEPDLLARRCDDISLANALRGAGLKAALHRHHFSATTERSTLVSHHTGFRLLGAAVLNDSLGGVNPAAVETALRMGAAWISLPTLSAHAFRRNLESIPLRLKQSLVVGPGQLRLIDDAGRLLPAVRDILALVGEHEVALGLGYGSFEEVKAVVAAGAAQGLARMVLTYPDLMRLTDAEIRWILAEPGVSLEICAFTLHPQGPSFDVPSAQRRALELIRMAGVERCVLSSDGGSAGTPPPDDLLGWLYTLLLEHQLSVAQVRMMGHENPARLLKLG